ncbi:MAG TPA: hypothetical protein VKD26_05615 [Streptosporangiaceae bacterium]|nr:hypothetical protein [Streptosporangiaceae bacterium]
MGRLPEPPDPAPGSLAEFAVGLQALRQAAGNPSFEELARRSDEAAPELAAAVSGRIVPSFPITLAFVRACQGDEDEWARRWHILQERLGAEAERAAARLARSQDPWLDVTPEDEWLAMASSRIQLTDAPAYPGDFYHVTASAARANCS